jgi:transcription initiation factor TFIID subunit 13
VSSQLAPPWPFNPQETALIRAGYRPAFKPNTAKNEDPAPVANSLKTKRRCSMAEPRARAARHKGQMNFASERKFVYISYSSRGILCAIVCLRGK